MNPSAAVMAQLRTNRIEPNSGRFFLFFSFFFPSFFFYFIFIEMRLYKQIDIHFDIEPFLKILGFLKLRNTENLTATNHEVPLGGCGHGKWPRLLMPNPINSFSLEL